MSRHLNENLINAGEVYGPHEIVGGAIATMLVLGVCASQPRVPEAR